MLHSQPTGTSSEEVRPVYQSLTSETTVAVTATGVPAHSEMNSDDDPHYEPGSPAGTSEEQDELSDRETLREEDFDQELSEEANYQETMMVDLSNEQERPYQPTPLSAY